MTSGHFSKPVIAPHTITDEQPDLKVGAKQSKEKRSCDFRHTFTCLDLFPILNEVSSIHITFLQSEVVQCLCSLENANLSALCFD